MRDSGGKILAKEVAADYGGVSRTRSLQPRICHGCCTVQLRSALRPVDSEQHASNRAEVGWGPERQAMWVQQFVRGLFGRQAEHRWVQLEFQFVSSAVFERGDSAGVARPWL